MSSKNRSKFIVIFSFKKDLMDFLDQSEQISKNIDIFSLIQSMPISKNVSFYFENRSKLNQLSSLFIKNNLESFEGNLPI